MSIQVKFFASLREQVGLSDITIEQASTAAEVWDLATDKQQQPDNVLVAINLEYAKLNSSVNDGDEVAFFPPVTGG
ncbi:MAG: molybdopterin converting factor subunit 1 [Gammaproteobacteria bacterium]|nr:molybdopterin converting factor subunit 1 [Gammaproteobacteria bacterium]MDT8371144.1 molybdopterin converting factor subunit 1 [Gammaproteobacteria bacterium]